MLDCEFSYHLQKKISKVVKLVDQITEEAIEIDNTQKLDPEMYNLAGINGHYIESKLSFFIKLLTYTSSDQINFSDKLLKLLDVRIKQLTRLLDDISFDIIGTCLNVISEIWNDMSIDLDRHLSKMQ